MQKICEAISKEYWPFIFDEETDALYSYDLIM